MEKPFASLTLCVREIRDALRGRGVRTLSCNLSVAQDDFIPNTLCECAWGVKKRLDKVFASRDWKDKYHAVVVRHLNPYKSNHIPILLEIFRRIIRNVKWLFREHKILLIWVSPSSKQKDIDGIQAKLGFILAQPISDVFLAEMANLLTQLDDLLSKEKAFWRQRAKNRIRELTNLQGTWSENIQEIENSVLGYFNNIIKSNQGSDLDADEIFDALDQKIDVDMLHVLEAEFMDT
ncbi:hypothetical protein ACFX1S_038617 [Malus domestica]